MSMKKSTRILVQFTTITRTVDNKEIPSLLPKVFTDWYDLADYIKQENEAERDVTIKRWEYV